jgi:hypothetical protein
MVEAIDDKRTMVSFMGDADPKDNISSVNLLSSNQGEVVTKIAPPCQNRVSDSNNKYLSEKNLVDSFPHLNKRPTMLTTGC